MLLFYVLGYSILTLKNKKFFLPVIKISHHLLEDNRKKNKFISFSITKLIEIKYKYIHDLRKDLVLNDTEVYKK